MASDEPRANCHPTKNTSATTASAIASVNHLNTLSPRPDGGAIRSIVDLTAGLSGATAIGMMACPRYILISSTRFNTRSRKSAGSGA